MRAVLQRVTQADVQVDGDTTGAIDQGILVLLGVARDDSVADVDYLVDKLVNLRIFEDDAGKMNLSLEQIGGKVLAVSQFTLLADCRKGRRPGFSAAAPPDEADALYQGFVARLRQRGIAVECGVFQADMKVSLINDGPVTLLLDSRKEF
ncbi:D-tyrosyl-tRNA(Tyr) deacylase [Desulfuromonas acetoxidans]|uniref:D-aminoacyl-tRNA deacylase n=1 Tax=Desulfuromonas acetoxidans (strain DSM 684 / 11070) TaxID=281689 RepID=Q1K3Q8_DESA6|nr:D-aminoacyl-tRNA deacylase [Desulfuromonas acetoxidans]EAT16916.1 D-tyrosyl-tRNA(Tyr) deacylase [Desulfuromonas acetoxidans DSM 684]MBF0644555.1 D-tyrosyl-tRNA(Tyr) deacylase [Desulfuromonas acetoxidans]NVD23918.1 D-tyrosyl-tRNA(Tyr) deacylase [Desulfuromonas acetoxidans]NVE16215.1 D-tyrosyl-tRNA(Tyr) deacylase [Desulfuromonas acetoxidans]